MLGLSLLATLLAMKQVDPGKYEKRAWLFKIGNPGGRSDDSTTGVPIFGKWFAIHPDGGLKGPWGWLKNDCGGERFAKKGWPPERFPLGNKCDSGYGSQKHGPVISLSDPDETNNVRPGGWPEKKVNTRFKRPKDYFICRKLKTTPWCRRIYAKWNACSGRAGGPFPLGCQNGLLSWFDTEGKERTLEGGYCIRAEIGTNRQFGLLTSPIGMQT